jgi:aspartate carbamoyltransferase catalytic subunit
LKQTREKSVYAGGSLLSVAHLPVGEVSAILAATARLEKMAYAERSRMLAGRRVALLFYESSTRTRTSFELAAKSLGATTTLVSDKSSSIEKGESLKDTGLTLRALGAECIVLRHPCSGAPFLLARETALPVLNAGDGMHEHPSQALLDLRTMLMRLPGHDASAVTAKSLEGITVVITGDILHSRVARSNLWGLSTMGADVTLCAPHTLLGPEAFWKASWPKLTISTDLDECLAGADVIMALRLQKERQEAGLLPSLREYSRFFGITAERVQLAAPHCLVMHPGPMNEGVEIMPDVAVSAQSVIEEQVTNGVAVRMALLYRLANE